MRTPARRYVFGHSLGAAVAVRLAAEAQDEAGFIVGGAFISSIDVLRNTRWGWLPVAPLMTQHFDAASRIAQVGSPLLVVQRATTPFAMNSIADFAHPTGASSTFGRRIRIQSQ